MKQLRLIVTMVRFPIAVLLMLFAALGIAQAGYPETFHPLFTSVLFVVCSWFVFSGCLNDLGDEAIDRINLAEAKNRPLVSGHASRKQLLCLAVASGAASLIAGWAVNWKVGAVVTAGLLLSVAYSVAPVRICDRGILATVLLPAGYVAVPYLIATFSVSPVISQRGMILLAGLYVTFMGRIVLKDFRDVEGDAAYGKRTFLLRYGRKATCRFSAACWILGSAAVFFILPPASPLIPAFGVLLVAALHGVRRLARLNDGHDESATIGALALAGRGMALLILAYFSVLEKGFGYPAQVLVFAALTCAVLGMYVSTIIQTEPKGSIRTAPKAVAGLASNDLNTQ